MATKVWMKNGILQVRFLVERAKAGIEFQMESEAHNCVCEHFGEGIKFSQNGKPVSPYIRKVEKVKRDAFWNKSACITKLVSILYTTTSSTLL